MKRTRSSSRWKIAVHRRMNSLKGLLTAPEKKLYSLGILSPRSLCLPDFLVIGAQKAGTTWLKKNLDYHPEIFMPTRTGKSDPTEVRYFDQEFHEPLSFYSDLFKPGMHRVKGDKSPNYCTIPLERIKFIRSIMPDVRLILMIRNPIERAWSHAAMNLMKFSGKKMEEISNSKFRRHFIRSQGRGDYPAILDRWLKIFPSEQLYVGFFEDISLCPKKLLSEVFAHLGVSQDVDWKSFPYQRVINKGPKVPIPEQHRNFLELMYGRAIEDLYQRFGSKVENWRCLNSRVE